MHVGGGEMLVGVVTQALRRGEEQARFFSCSSKVSHKKKGIKNLQCWKKPAALNTLFTVGNVPPADIHIQQGAREAKTKKKKNETERDRSWTRMSMFPFFIWKVGERRQRKVTWITERCIITKKEKKKTDFFSLSLLSAGVSLRSQQS